MGVQYGFQLRQGRRSSSPCTLLLNGPFASASRSSLPITSNSWHRHGHYPSPSLLPILFVTTSTPGRSPHLICKPDCFEASPVFIPWRQGGIQVHRWWTLGTSWATQHVTVVCTVSLNSLPGVGFPLVFSLTPLLKHTVGSCIVFPPY